MVRTEFLKHDTNRGHSRHEVEYPPRVLFHQDRVDERPPLGKGEHQSGELGSLHRSMGCMVFRGSGGLIFTADVEFRVCWREKRRPASGRLHPPVAARRKRGWLVFSRPGSICPRPVAGVTVAMIVVVVVVVVVVMIVAIAMAVPVVLSVMGVASCARVFATPRRMERAEGRRRRVGVGIGVRMHMSWRMGVELGDGRRGQRVRGSHGGRRDCVWTVKVPDPPFPPLVFFCFSTSDVTGAQLLQILFSAYHGMEIGEGSEASRDASSHAVSVRDLEIWRPWPLSVDGCQASAACPGDGDN